MTTGLKSVAPIDTDDTPRRGSGRADHSLSKSIAEVIATEELLPFALPPPPPGLKRPLALFELRSMCCFS